MACALVSSTQGLVLAGGGARRLALLGKTPAARSCTSSFHEGASWRRRGMPAVRAGGFRVIEYPDGTPGKAVQARHQSASPHVLKALGFNSLKVLVHVPFKPVGFK